LLEKIDNINNIESDCEKVKSLADEYLHGELSELTGLSEEKDFIEKHIIDCLDCRSYIDEEKIYLDAIRSAEYVPEISISQSVMDKIIENRIAAGKPKRKRFVPVGFLSAAAVIVIMFLISKGGPLNLFMKASQDNAGNAVNNSISDSMSIEPYAGDAQFNAYNDETVAAAPVSPAGFGLDITAATEAGTEIPLLTISPRIAVGDFTNEAEENLGTQAGISPAAAPMPEAVDNSIFGLEMDEYIPEVSGLDMSEIYEIYYMSGYNKEADRPKILKDIEVYKTDSQRFMFDIIDKKYKDALNQNFKDNNITIGEILNKNQDGKFIVVVYWMN